MFFDSIINKKAAVSFNGKDHLFSFLKGISWRIVGTLDTMLISYFVTGEITLAVSIGLIEVFTKVGLFYFHDRLWERIRKRYL